MQLKVYNTEAKEIGTVELKDEVFNVPYNEALIHQVYVAYQANQRQGTKCTLTKAEVRGGGKKPWRQKGTGRARHGSIRSPQWRGGGVIFAPKPRDFSKSVNVKAKRLAIMSAISFRAVNNEITVLDGVKIKAPKTKEVANILKKFSFEKRTLMIIAERDELLLRASANIPNLTVTTAELLNIYDLISNASILATKDALKKFEEANA